ncbi:MAG TPA: glutaredoxin family protein [Candidatus Andersenbacteria bacterium]|nr:glutaredoxin family protein [Candidatus Andersenbacteria bacterium]
MKVTIYTTKTCGYCKATKEFFAKHNIPYTEIDVSTDQAQARAMIERSGQMGVPVIIIGEKPNEQLIIGYDRDALAKALHIQL